MASCEHISWLEVSGQKRWHLHYVDRIAQVLEQMINPGSQYPSSLFFIGGNVKNTALREIFPYNNVRKYRQEGFVNLRLDSFSLTSEFPLLILDGDPTPTVFRSARSALCHSSNIMPLPWTECSV